MKIKYFLLSAIVLATSFASCVDDKEYVYDEGNNVKFNATVAGQSTLTRAAGTAWQAGDAIGIYMKTGTGLTNIVDGAANQKHTTATTTGKFSPADPIKNAIFFPTKGTVDFIAYYPYADKLENNVYKVDVTNQASQEKIDLLYSNDATGKSNGDAVTLNFTHQLTKVVFSLKGANADIDLTSVKVEISDMPTKGTYDLASGALTVEEAKAAIVLKSTVDAASKLNAVAEGIVIPTAKATRKVSFTFKRAGQTETHTWDASGQPFDKGMKNSYNVQLGGDKGVLVSPESNIQDWGPGSSQDIIIDLDGDGETTLGDGTQANPYTVADAALKVGTNETWVTGIILGSSTKTKSLGGASKDNIVLATVAGETDESKWIIIDLIGSGVAGNLDIVTNSELIGKAVKVKGNIVKDIFGGALAMTLITAQEGGKDGTTPPVGEEKEFFFENFGITDVATTRAKIGEYKEYTMKSPIVFSDPYGTSADLRTTKGFLATYNMHVWLPASFIDSKTKEEVLVEAALNIKGIEAGYKNITLSYEIAANTANTNANALVVKCNGVAVEVPSTNLAVQNEFTKIEFKIPDNTTEIEFYTPGSLWDGYRLDNVKLIGTK